MQLIKTSINIRNIKVEQLYSRKILKTHSEDYKRDLWRPRWV